MDRPLRKLEREALSGDPEAQRLYLAALRRSVTPLTSDDLKKLKKLITKDLKERGFILSIGHLSWQHYIDDGKKSLLDYLHEQLSSGVRVTSLPNWAAYAVAAPKNRRCYFYKQHLGNDFELVNGQDAPAPKFRYVVRTAPLPSRDLQVPDFPVPVRVAGYSCHCDLGILFFSGCQCGGD